MVIAPKKAQLKKKEFQGKGSMAWISIQLCQKFNTKAIRSKPL